MNLNTSGQRVLIVRDRHASMMSCISLQSHVKELRDALENCLPLKLLVKRQRVAPVLDPQQDSIDTCFS